MPFSWDFVNSIPVLGQIKAGVHLCLPNQKEEAEKALTKSNQSTVILAAAIVGKIFGGNAGVHRAEWIRLHLFCKYGCDAVRNKCHSTLQCLFRGGMPKREIREDHCPTKSQAGESQCVHH